MDIITNLFKTQPDIQKLAADPEIAKVANQVKSLVQTQQTQYMRHRQMMRYFIMFAAMSSIIVYIIEKSLKTWNLVTHQTNPDKQELFKQIFTVWFTNYGVFIQNIVIMGILLVFFFLLL